MNGRRVVVLDHTGQLGGAEIALQRLLLAVDDSWDVSVLLFSDGPFRESLERDGIDVEVLTLPERTSGQSRSTLTDPRVLLRSGVDSIAFARRLAQRLRGMKAELVVANSLKSAVLAEMSSWRSRLPWVWHLHDRIAPDYLPTPVVFALRGLARRATRVVANSHHVAQLTCLPPSAVSVAYPGLPADAFTDSHASPEPPVLGILGRISATKGQREFLEAAAIVSRAHPEVRFRIVGDALFSDQPYAREVRQFAEDLDIAQRVAWTGWSPDPREALDGFTAMVHASPVPEPFGQVIVEAMARHVPVIATVGGGVGEIFDAASNNRLGAGTVLVTPYGRLVGAKDARGIAAAMNGVLENPFRAESLARAAYGLSSSRYTIAATANAVSIAWKEATRPQLGV